jgi:two-component system, NarL family, sensor histidine kinase DesK
MSSPAPSIDTSRAERLALHAMQVVAVAWLGALIQPLSDLGKANLPPPRLAVTIAGTAIFVGTYLGMSWSVTWSRRISVAGRSEREGAVWLPIGILTGLSVAFSLGYGGSWLELFIFSAVGAGFRLPTRVAAWTIGGLVLLGMACAVATSFTVGTSGQTGSPSDLVRLGLLIGSPGFAIMTVVHSVTTVRELRAARAEIARLAVADERLRFARDLHDLLGRSPSLIALKSELAGQLAPTAPDRAVAEMKDVEQVARTALQEVRDAVAGYRQPTLAGELRAAGEILAAAGIGFSHDQAPPALPLATAAVLAWAVREGVTNVIRHSRARSCTIRFSVNATEAGLTVTDDGRRPPATPSSPPVPAGANGRPSGHGLAGLAERVAALGGTCRASPQTGGGFRLAVSLPLAAAAAPAPTPEAPAYGGHRQ